MFAEMALKRLYHLLLAFSLAYEVSPQSYARLSKWICDPEASGGGNRRRHDPSESTLGTGAGRTGQLHPGANLWPSETGPSGGIRARVRRMGQKGRKSSH